MLSERITSNLALYLRIVEAKDVVARVRQRLGQARIDYDLSMGGVQGDSRPRIGRSQQDTDRRGPFQQVRVALDKALDVHMCDEEAFRLMVRRLDGRRHPRGNVLLLHRTQPCCVTVHFELCGGTDPSALDGRGDEFMDRTTRATMTPRLAASSRTAFANERAQG